VDSHSLKQAAASLPAAARIPLLSAWAAGCIAGDAFAVIADDIAFVDDTVVVVAVAGVVAAAAAAAAVVAADAAAAVEGWSMVEAARRRRMVVEAVIWPGWSSAGNNSAGRRLLEEESVCWVGTARNQRMMNFFSHLLHSSAVEHFLVRLNFFSFLGCPFGLLHRGKLYY